MVYRPILYTILYAISILQYVPYIHTYYTYYIILYYTYYTIVYNSIVYYIQLYCTTIGVQLVDAQQIQRRNVVDTTRVHGKTTRNVNTNALSASATVSCAESMQSKHWHIPAYPALFPSLLMQNDTVQHLLKSHFVYIVISLSLYFHNLAELHLFIVI